MKRFVCLFMVWIAITVIPVDADTIHVPGDFPTIQEAIDAAADGDTVLVADGTYTGDGNVDLEISDKNITLASVNGAEATIIDCFDLVPWFVLTDSSSLTIDGFTIQRSPRAIYVIIESHITIQNSNLRDNSIAVICAGVDTSAVITDCMFTDNGTAIAGVGGMQLPIEVSNCTFVQTGGIEYEAIGSLNITNCLFANIFDGGQTGQLGAISFRPTVDDATLNVVNSTITGNTAIQGGGIYMGAGFLELKNTLLWNNIAGEGNEIYFETSTGSATITFCDIRGGQEAFGGNPPPIVYENNIDADPLFVSADGHDYHLLENSPCIDAGTDEGAPDTDIEGNPRPLGNGVDIGAYEQLGFPAPTHASIDITALPNPVVAGEAFQVEMTIDGLVDDLRATIIFSVAAGTQVREIFNRKRLIPTQGVTRTIYSRHHFNPPYSTLAYIAVLLDASTGNYLDSDIEVVEVIDAPESERLRVERLARAYVEQVRQGVTAAPQQLSPTGKLSTTWAELKARD